MGVDIWAEPAIAGVLGLLLGSFLNVVIHRLPKMMEHQSAQEHAAFAADADAHAPATASARGAQKMRESCRLEPVEPVAPLACTPPDRLNR